MKLKGSFTVEISLIFPVIILVLLALLQCALYFSYRIYTICMMEQGLALCLEQRREGAEIEQAAEAARSHVQERLAVLPVTVQRCEVTAEDGWLEESYTIWVEAEYTMLLSLSWQTVLRQEWMDPLTFRNRVDYLWEKGREYIQG